MRWLVYTCVAGGYDRVYPPLVVDPDTDYVIVTDDASLQVPGWRTHAVDASAYPTPQLMNRYFKMLAHREFKGYQASLYVDGNVRLLGSLRPVFQPFLSSGLPLKFFRHPKRHTVASEIAACIQRGKVQDAGRLHAEWEHFQADGFADDAGLVEATILLKDHLSADTDLAMALWWSLYQQHQTRDQTSLPYVLWKTGIGYAHHDFHFRDPNPYFGLYPHCGAAHVPPLYSHLSARAYDSVAHKVLLGLWQATWAIRRAIRRLVKQRSEGNL
jgi:hypothetical protein